MSFLILQMIVINGPDIGCARVSRRSFNETQILHDLHRLRSSPRASMGVKPIHAKAYAGVCAGLRKLQLAVTCL